MLGGPDLAALRGRVVAVTGAGGFVGRRLCARLVAEGATVSGLDVAPPAAAAIEGAGAAFRLADTTDPAALAAALDGCDAVVHLAAYVGEWGAMDEYVRVNVGGTRAVLDAAGDRRVVHVSSVASFGYGFGHELDEDAAPRRVGGPYFDTKAASDELARRRGAVVVRPGDVYGPESRQWAIRPLEAIRGRRLVLPARGEGLLTPVYVDDLVDCLGRALVAPDSACGRAFHAWDGMPVTAKDFFAFYARMLGRRGVPSARGPLLALVAAGAELHARATGATPDVTREALRYLSRTHTYSTARAREELGWAPQVDLVEGMRRTEAWCRATGLL